MATAQIAVRIPSQLLARVDELIRGHTFESRAAAVRAGLELVTDLARRQALDEQIVEGYRRCPPTSAEEEAALASLRHAIGEEPW